MDDHGPWLRLGALVMAAIAGTVTALSLMPWQEMSTRQVVITLASGFGFAVFVTPWLAQAVFGVPFANTQALCGMTYVFGSGWNVLLPKLIKWAGGKVSGGDGE